MTDFQVLIDLHKNNHRQGPGSDAVTEKALGLIPLSDTTKLKIADLGSGTGAQTLILAKLLKGDITAIDLFPDFLNILAEKAEKHRVSKSIKTVEASIDALPFEPNSLDLIWSEGAIYNIGFEEGIRYWHSFLKPGGFIAVSEITWLTDSRPKEIEEYWQKAYPQIDTATNKIQQLKRSGYHTIGHFMLPPDCWLEHYYKPLQDGFDAFLNRHHNSALAREIVAQEIAEIALYSKYKTYYSYGFYVAQKI